MIEYRKNDELILKDKKGTWKAGYVRRQLNSNGSFSFYISLEFVPNMDRLPRASTSNENIFMRQCEDIKTLKNQIKSYIGYTPEKETIYGVWDRLMHFMKSYEEEDHYYAGQDKAAAQQLMQNLIELAKSRFLAGEEIEDLSGRKNSKPKMERYLTQEEIQIATEAQKILNGHSNVDPLSVIAKTGHLAVFNKTIDEETDRLAKLQEFNKARQIQSWHRELLESDVTFRRLVALVLHAKKEIRSGSTEKELAQMLFGYCFSFTDYRDRVLPPFRDLLAKYQLDTYDMYKLVTLGSSYMEEGGMLPVPQPLYFRQDGKIYYGVAFITEKHASRWNR